MSSLDHLFRVASPLRESGKNTLSVIVDNGFIISTIMMLIRPQLTFPFSVSDGYETLELTCYQSCFNQIGSNSKGKQA